MKTNELLDQIFDKRVEMILQSRIKAQKKLTEKEEAILASFDEKVKMQVEELFSDRNVEAFEEYRLIYKSGFLDGLRLGHKAF